MQLNRAPILYSNFQEEQQAFKEMMVSAHQVAGMLMSQPEGVCAEIMGQNWFVAHIDGYTELDLFCCPEDPKDYTDPPNCNVIILCDIEGQSAEDLQSLKAAMDAWLLSPVYKDCNQMILNGLVSFYYQPEPTPSSGPKV